MRLSRKELFERARGVKLVLMDIDGVLTGGLIYHVVDSAARLVEFKGVHSHDSIALSWLSQHGLKTGVISGRQSEGIAERLKLVHVCYIYQGRLDKLAVFDEICAKAEAAPSEVLYMGDDLPDIPVIKRAGIGVAVPQARREVKAAAHWVTAAEGGRGAVREAAELVLSARGLWPAILAQFEAEPAH